MARHRKTGHQNRHDADSVVAEQGDSGDAAYRQYVRNKIARGLADIRAGRVVSHEEVLARLLRGGPLHKKS